MVTQGLFPLTKNVFVREENLLENIPPTLFPQMCHNPKDKRLQLNVKRERRWMDFPILENTQRGVSFEGLRMTDFTFCALAAEGMLSKWWDCFCLQLHSPFLDWIWGCLLFPRHIGKNSPEGPNSSPCASILAYFAVGNTLHQFLPLKLLPKLLIPTELPPSLIVSTLYRCSWGIFHKILLLAANVSLLYTCFKNCCQQDKEVVECHPSICQEQKGLVQGRWAKKITSKESHEDFVFCKPSSPLLSLFFWHPRTSSPTRNTLFLWQFSTPPLNCWKLLEIYLPHPTSTIVSWHNDEVQHFSSIYKCFGGIFLRFNLPRIICYFRKILRLRRKYLVKQYFAKIIFLQAIWNNFVFFLNFTFCVWNTSIIWKSIFNFLAAEFRFCIPKLFFFLLS